MRELGKLSAALADVGLEVTYAYDDLVFIQNSAFMMQYSEKNDEALRLFVSRDFTGGIVDVLVGQISRSCEEAGLNVQTEGRFAIEETTNGQVNIRYLPAA